MLELPNKYIGQKDFGFHPSYGRLPKVYYLKQAGVKYLVEQHHVPIGLIKFRKGKSRLFERDLFHRIAVIDFHIQFREWVTRHGHEDVGFTTYFEQGKTGVESNRFETSQGTILPDAI